MSATTAQHISVLLNEVTHALSPIEGKVIVDATFGAGGYSRHFLEKGAAHVIGIDRDPLAFQCAQHADFLKDNFTFLKGRFSDMTALMKQTPFTHVDAIVLDIGVSSMQLDEAERGFSFMKDGPLDMRMSSDGLSAADIINEYEEAELADIFYYLGEERHARKIARVICQQRAHKPITTTLMLADLIAATLPKNFKEKKHPATRSFQALRLAVNEELEELKTALKASLNLLNPNGVLAVVTFHSLEDRIVKQFLNTQSGKIDGVSRHMPLPPESATQKTYFKLPRGYPIAASEEEIKANPRSRSAKLRIGIHV